MPSILQLCAVDFTAYHLLRPIGLAFRKAGYDVTFCSSDGEGLRLLEREGFNTRVVEISRNFNVFSHIRSLVSLYGLMKRERFDVVHVHTPVAGLLGRVAAKFAGIECIVYTAHGFYFHDEMSPPAKKIFVFLERLAGSISDLIFVQSAEDLEEAVKEKVAPRDKLVHIGNGVDPELFGKELYIERREPLKKEFGLEGRTVIGYVGRIVKEKGVEELVKAASIVKKSIPEAIFLLVGEALASDRDDCGKELDRIIEESGIEGDVVFTGYRNDVPALLSLMDVFVLPSYREGMPRALIEAMATGLPAVATDIRGCREEVVEGETGLLVPPGDEESLSSAIIRLARDREAMDSMGSRARRRVLEHFDESKITGRQLDKVNELLRRSVS